MLLLTAMLSRNKILAERIFGSDWEARRLMLTAFRLTLTGQRPKPPS